MKNPIKWAPLLNLIYDNKSITCPECGSNKVTYRFCARDKVGYAQFKCEECGEDAHLSRVKFPDHVSTEKF